MGRSKSSASNKSESSSNVSSVKCSSSISDGKEISTEVKWSDLLTQLKGHVNNVQVNCFVTAANILHNNCVALLIVCTYFSFVFQDTHSRCEQSLGSIAKVREKVVQDQKSNFWSKSIKRNPLLCVCN